MSSVSDTDPVTRSQLREELASQLAKYPTREELDERLARYATKVDIETWAFALLDKIERIFKAELQGAVRILSEQHMREITILDDKYKTLPARVERLEAAVFPPKRTRRR
jgi:hypothetical protein